MPGPINHDIYYTCGDGSILPILVLYNVRIADSPAFRTLCEHAGGESVASGVIAVYDNSLVRQVSSAEEASIYAYRHDPCNSGLAAAYNWAASLAEGRDLAWLLLLDQDSTFPAEFLQKMSDTAKQYASDAEVVAIVPRVRSRFGPVSPSLVKFGHLARVPERLSGIVRRPITAINSGTLVRMSFVKSIGGFNRDFHLDALDHWLFHQIYASGHVAATFPIEIQHDLSVQNFQQEVSAARFRTIVASETLFVVRYKNRAERWIYLFRLLLRSAKQCLAHGSLQNAGFTLSMIPRILHDSDQITGASAP